ncbi:hypothetical protein AVEN_248818-1 [Araneus ventricosus]|uniref:DUF5641 domain-containing protein n=1 Tax=Araneus ventricosus TaxID=182803 RepID=A0A4Y2J4N7_ARAVE|nr:hypothetical protein AVEN_248818-1 [Araneus ventricosus]
MGVRIVLSELRSSYWILHGREAIKRVIHRCLPCRLSKAPRGTRIEAPLPADRMTPFIPFSTTGSDFAAHYIYFIVPLAACCGGWWERLIGLTKQCLRKSLGRALLDEEGLQTALIGIEAALNSRPLVYEQENDIDEILTPAHFLTGKKSDREQKITNFTRNYRIQQDLLDTFWRKWPREYLLQLSTFHQVRNSDKSSHVREGDVHIIAWKRNSPTHVEKSSCRQADSRP